MQRETLANAMALKKIGITYCSGENCTKNMCSIGKISAAGCIVKRWTVNVFSIEFSLTSILAFQAKLRLEMAAEHGKHMVQKELESKEDELEQYRFNMQKKVPAISTSDDQLIFTFVVVVTAEVRFQRADRSQHHD